MPLSSAISQFFHEFEVLETRYIGTAFRAFTGDLLLIERAQARMQLEARLTLLKRIAMGRVIYAPAVEVLEQIIKRTARLQNKRDDLFRNSMLTSGESFRDEESSGNTLVPLSQRRWVPTENEIDECHLETIRLQQSLRELSETFRRDSAA